MGFSQKDYDNLKVTIGNTYLNKSSEDKYKNFSNIDPFPNISSALLNSEEIIKYISTTGMIDPFIPENLGDATYTCTFSGKYLRYDNEGKADTTTLSDDDELSIEPNSITYLEIDEKFMIPQYIILRFNLKVHHVYKGLLLGTGPIVDPGFVGKLYIPLHNLTLNNYVIKKGAGLISVEFTKLSLRENWKIDESSAWYKYAISKLDFTCLSSYTKKPIKPIQPDRDVAQYINKSLQGDSKFHKNPKNELSISSSLANYVTKLEKMDERIEVALKEMKKYRNYAIGGTIITAITILIGIVALVYPSWQGLDAIQKERTEYNNTISQYKNEIDQLGSRIFEIELENKEAELDLLKKEYAKYADKDIDEAVELKNQINALENEVNEMKEKRQ